ncbi:MAG: hypothetical protein FJY80_15070 [Candidatus Aminicenantes bacterium]|nr:hypothetical protein [Candidatus Aminicenantes bacterium]
MRRFPFEWNDLADQPHNVAPRSERTLHHLTHWKTYLALAWADFVWGVPALWRYRRYRRRMHRFSVPVTADMFALAVSPRFGRPAGETDALLGLLRETGVRQTLFRVPSWEKGRLAEFEAFARRVRSDEPGRGLAAALLQRREDVFEGGAWARFLEEAFARLGPHAPYFEIGHAWNRTKWGVWDHAEYIKLARPAAALRDRQPPRSRVKLVGPAVIDFEFHLYPPTLRAVDFDVVSSLLYVDRVGAPENAQAGWTAAMKLALFAAVADASSRRPVPAWITEVNWPLAGTGPYSPAAGKPNVGEEAQADYLVRYYVLCLTSGLIDRVVWWQLVAPGYGLVDSRETPWRRRPSFFAFKTMVERLSGSLFVGKDERPPLPGGGRAEVYLFTKNGREFALAWTAGPPGECELGRPAAAVFSRDGGEVPCSGTRVRLDSSPRYILF